MLSEVSSWLIKNGLTDSFKRAAAVPIPVEDKSWLLLICTEALKNKIQNAFSSRVQGITKLSTPPTA